MILSARNKDISMDETLRGYFSAKSLAEASALLSRSSVDYDDLMMAVADNLPLRYTDPARLAEAYDFLSQADMYRGRIGTENWHLLKYYYNSLAEAAAVQPESYKPFTFISPPIKIITLFWTKGKRTMLDSICAKIGKQCHVSRKTAKEDFIPFLKIMIAKQKATPALAWLELAPEEIDFLAKMNKF
jgi:replication factor C large subunit